MRGEPGVGSLRSPRYQIMLVALLSANFGIVFFDRNALNFLMPFVRPDLGMTNTEVGLLSSALSLSWAAAGFFIGRHSDRTGRRKSIIVAATVAFSVCSFLSGLASTFAMLLGVRLFMGLAEGGVLPVSQSLTASELVPAHRGLAMGVMQNFGSNALGSSLAPIILVAIAAEYGWRSAFFVAGVPGLFSALLIWLLVREATVATQRAASEVSRGEHTFLKERNIWVCALIAALLVAHAVVGWAFIPLFLTTERRFDSASMGWMMAVLGLSASIGGFVVAAISDRLGRKPILLTVSVVSMVLPLGALYFDGPRWMLATVFFVGWSVNSLIPLVMATIPSETVDPRYTATVLGIVMGAGEVLGGVLGPFGAGAAADRFGLQAPLWIMFGLCVAAAVLTLALRETAPRIIGIS